MARRHVIRVMVLLIFFAAAAAVSVLLVTRVLYPLPYRDIIVGSAAVHDLDPFLVTAVIREESRFREDAVSPKGARGLMQLMPVTGQWVAERMGMEEFGEEDLHDPQINILMGCWYLSHLLESFDGSVPLAVAAYNRGATRVRTWLAEGIWSGCPSELDDVPTEETRVYLQRVLRSRTVYRWLYHSSLSNETR